MSTKTSLFHDAPEGEHKLQIHINKEMHKPKGIVAVEFSCSTCNSYNLFLMNEHMAFQLVEKFKGGEK